MKYVSLSLSVIALLMTAISMFLVINQGKAIGVVISNMAIMISFIALGIALCI